MRLRRGEVEVHRDNVARLDKSHGDDVLAGSALVSGQEVFCAEYFAHFVFKFGKGRAARVTVVGDEHGGLLPVAHGVDAAVGQHIHIYVFVLKQKCVVSRLGNAFEPFFHRRKIEFLHDTHFVHFQRDLFSAEKFHVCHCSDSPKKFFFCRDGRKKARPLPNQRTSRKPVLPPQFIRASRREP